MILLVGVSGSGKSSIYRELLRRGYDRVLITTTRKQRVNEAPGLEYRFVSNFKFLIEKLFGRHICESKFKLASGKTVRYGLPIISKEMAENAVVIVNPRWLKHIKEFADKKNIPYMIAQITASESEISRRLMDRGDNLAEVQRRMHADKCDFILFESELHDSKVYNNKTDSLKIVAAKIVSDYENNYRRLTS